MNALRFIFQLIDRMSGPARKIRDSLAGVRRELARTRLSFNQLYDATSGLRTLAAITGAALAGMTVAAAAGFAALAIQSASFKEQNESAFQIILRSKKAGTDLYNQAVRFAAVTPFDTKTVISSYQQLLGYGFKPIELPVVLSGVGDLASIKGFTPEAVQRIITAMGQIRAKGRLLGNEMMQLTEAGFSQGTFYQIVSKKLGVSVDKVRKLQEAGRIDSGTALGGILETIRQTASGGKLGALMKQQSETLAGLWSTLTSRPFEMLQHFDKAGAFKDLKAVVKNLGDAFDTATPKGQAMSKALVSLADTIVGGVFGPLKDATNAQNMTRNLERITAGIRRFQVFWRAAWPQAMAFFRGFVSGVQAGWSVIANAYQQAKPVIDWLSAFVGRLTGAGAEAGSTGEKIGRLVGFLGVMAVAAGGLSMLLMPIKLLLSLGDAFVMVWRMGRGVVGTFKEVAKLAKAFKEWGGISRVLGAVGRAFGTVWKGLGNAVKWFLKAGPVIGRFFMALRAGISFLFASNPVGFVILVITAIVGVLIWAYNRFDWFHKAVDGVWNGIKLAAGIAWQAIRNTVVNTWNSLVTWADTSGVAFLDSIINGITNAGAAMSNAWTTIKDFVINTWNSLTDWAAPAGIALIDGIINGVTAGAARLRETITNLSGNVATWFKERLGIHSPSRVFDTLGGFIMTGLINGITAGNSAISSTVKGVSDLLREMWIRYAPKLEAVAPTIAAGAAQNGPSTAFGARNRGTGAGAGARGAVALPAGFAGASTNAIASAAMRGLTAGWAESLPGYCSRFVRQVFGKAIGPATARLFGSSAVQTERNFKAAGLSKTLQQVGGMAGLMAGDVLFQGFGSGGFGHTGVYVGGGMVAQNTTAAGGGRKLLPVSAFGAITSVGRLPGSPAPAPARAAPPVPMRQAAPAPANRGGNTVHVNNTLTVPPGTPAQQSAKLKADAHAASYQGAALALEQLALEGGHG